MQKIPKLKLLSSAFSDGDMIPVKYTGDGADLSPGLNWENAPDNVKEWALICDDPDAPATAPWVHWVLYKLPANVRSLPEGLPIGAMLQNPSGARQGRNSWTDGQKIGYQGPLPPRGHGVHHYHFKLYALNTELLALPNLDKTDLLRAMSSHILAEAELIGIYERKRPTK